MYRDSGDKYQPIQKHGQRRMMHRMKIRYGNFSIDLSKKHVFYSILCFNKKAFGPLVYRRNGDALANSGGKLKDIKLTVSEESTRS